MLIRSLSVVLSLALSAPAFAGVPAAAETAGTERHPNRDGRQLMAGGGSLASLGILLMGTGGFFVGCTTACTTVGIFDGASPQPRFGSALIGVGAVLASGGAIMLGAGASRWVKLRKKRVSLAPGRTVHGTWTAGVRMRF